MEFDTKLGLVPPHIRSSAVDLGSRIEAAETETTALAVNIFPKYHNPPTCEKLMQPLIFLKRGRVDRIRRERRAKALAENELLAASAQAAMFYGESTSSPWTESPMTSGYGTDFSALMNEMSPDVIEGFWEERHHMLRERLLQLRWLQKRLEELRGRIEQLGDMVDFVSGCIPHLDTDCSVHAPQNGQFTPEVYRSAEKAQLFLKRSYQYREQGRRVLRRCRWSTIQTYRFYLQSQRFATRGRRFAAQGLRFATKSLLFSTQSQRLLTHSRWLTAQSKLSIRQGQLFVTKGKLWRDYWILHEKLLSERLEAGQFVYEYLCSDL